MGEYLPEAPVDDEARERNGKLSGMGGVFNTVNLHLYHYAGNNPVKYTDPDGRMPRTIFEKQIESVTKAIVFLYRNKDAIQKIGTGVAKVAMGAGIGTLGVGGGVGITIGSGGTAALGGVALADVAIVAGGVYVGAGVADVLDGIVMMSQSNDNGGGYDQSAKDAKKIESNSDANKFAQSKGYKNAEDLKSAYISGQRDTNVAHYNIYENKKTGESFVIHNDRAKNLIIKILKIGE